MQGGGIGCICVPVCVCVCVRMHARAHMHVRIGIWRQTLLPLQFCPPNPPGTDTKGQTYGPEI